MIQRDISAGLQEALVEGSKVVVLYGPRRAGKTTLISSLLDSLPLKSLRLSADELLVQQTFSFRDLAKLDLMTRGCDVVFLDEAQRIPDIVLNLKLLHEHRPSLRLVITGSSSLEIVAGTREALTGRTRTFQLFPLSARELGQWQNLFWLEQHLPELLVYGSYPEVFAWGTAQEKASNLLELSTAYLYKDILDLMNLKHSNKLKDLLRLLAYQVGSQVSLSELALHLGLAKDTVSHYIDLLEKSFVLFRLGGFSRNLRKEMTKMDKIYFWDLGIRNAVLNNFAPLELRNDGGQLWENFLIVERLKYRANQGLYGGYWFWRTQTGAEIDLVEESNGVLSGYEFKWNNKKSREPATWTQTYPQASFTVINRGNYLGFLDAMD